MVENILSEGELDLVDNNLSFEEIVELNNSEIILENYEERPVQLIDFEGTVFKLNQEALKIIRSIEDEIIIVSIVGKARTGKSYLMNLLLDNIGKGRGFKVDPKVESCTKGIWLWANYRKSANNTKIIFIDSEGTSSTDRSTKTYDSKIFALVVLISSLFIYNSSNNIDEFGISELSLAAHLSNSIATNALIDKEFLISELAPKFIWVLRDFSLEKVHPETGEEICSNEYLEISLRKKISGKNSAENNNIRENIIKYFKNRECFTLPRPVESEKDLNQLDNIPFDQLKSNFKIEFIGLKSKIYKEAGPKIIKNKKMTGPVLANLIEEFVNAINKGSVPNINNAWDSVISKDINDYYNKALERFKQNVKCLKDIYEQENLVKMILDMKIESYLIYNKFLVINSETFYNNQYIKWYQDSKNKLEEETNKTEKKILSENYEKSKKHCIEVVKNEYKEITDNLFKNVYKFDSIGQLVNDFVMFLRIYLDRSIGIEKIKILINFLNENLKELIFYIVTVINTTNKQNSSNIENRIKENTIILKDMELAKDKLIEINNIYENRIRSLQFDKEIKDKEIKYKMERIHNLERELEILNIIKEERIKEENNLNEIRSSNVTRDNRKIVDQNKLSNKNDIHTIDTRFENEGQCNVCECLIF